MHVTDRLDRRRREVLRQHDIVEAEQWIRLGVRRFSRSHIERRSTQPSVAERISQRRLVDQPTTRHIDEQSVRSHVGELSSADEIFRLAGECCAQDDCIRTTKHLVQLEELDIGRRRLIDIRVEADRRHAEPSRLLRCTAPDTAKADHAERGVADPTNRGEVIPIVDRPRPGCCRCRERHDHSLQRHQQRDAVIRHLFGAIPRHVRDRDSHLGRQLGVDTIHPDRVAQDSATVHHRCDVLVRQVFREDHDIGERQQLAASFVAVGKLEANATSAEFCLFIFVVPPDRGDRVVHHDEWAGC